MSQKHPLNDQQKALAKVIAIFTVLSACLFGVLYWAKTNTESELAKQIRSTIGFAEPTDSTAPPAPVIEKVVVAPPPPPPPEPEPEPEPEPIAISFEQICNRRDLWPSQLTLTKAIEVPISYRGNTYGELSFPAGTPFTVDSLRKTQALNGYIEGNYLSIPVSQTDFVAWFNQRFDKSYVTEAPIEQAFTAANNLDDSHVQWDIHTQLLYWLQRNYGDCRIEIGENTLVMHWKPQTEVEIDYRFEAREVSHRYLMLQAEKGGSDNYASCEIYYTPTGELLGTGSIFVPSLGRK